MSVVKKCEQFCKNLVSMTGFELSWPSAKSRDKKFSASPKTPNKLPDFLNPGPSLAPSQVSKYIKGDLQQIFKSVFKAQTYVHD